MKRRGVPVVVSAPSGAGKTTLCRLVMERLEGITFSVSHTTRPPRAREQNGVDYHFVDESTFDHLVSENAFLEWAHVHGHRYGTAHAAVEKQLAAGCDVFFDIDVQGGRQVADRVADAVLVFVVPPNREVLEARLRGRGTDSEEQVRRRLLAATLEIEAADFYTHWLVNDDLETAAADLLAVVRGERLRRVDRAALCKALSVTQRSS